MRSTFDMIQRPLRGCIKQFCNWGGGRCLTRIKLEQSGRTEGHVPCTPANVLHVFLQPTHWLHCPTHETKPCNAVRFSKFKAQEQIGKEQREVRQRVDLGSGTNRKNPAGGLRPRGDDQGTLPAIRVTQNSNQWPQVSEICRASSLVPWNMKHGVGLCEPSGQTPSLSIGWPSRRVRNWQTGMSTLSLGPLNIERPHKRSKCATQLPME